MKFTKISFLILSLITILSSCEKFLDAPLDTIDSFIKTPEDCQQLLDNFDAMNNSWPSSGQLSDDDFFLSEMAFRSQNAYFRTYLYTWPLIEPPRIGENSPQDYNECYIAISYANLVVENVDKMFKQGATDATLLNQLKGQALFFRAFGFWNLAQIFTAPYQSSTANQAMGIPLRITSDLNDLYERGTVQQTYDRIVADLNAAIPLLPVTTASVTRPGKAAGYAMLARVFLSKADYPNALINATAALQINNTLNDFNTLPRRADIQFSFNVPSLKNKEILFFSAMDDNSDLSNLGQGSPNIDTQLADSFDSLDLRKIIFMKPDQAAEGSYIFSGSYSDQRLFNGLATDEIYLTRAECYARGNKITESMADLNKLLRTRWKTGTYTDQVAQNADEALSIILRERRKELMFRGLRWTDLRRLNLDPKFQKTLTRTVKINGVTNTYTLHPNDLRYVLLFPKPVLENSNPKMQQNPR